MGSATGGEPALANDVVYALHGVPTEELVVMRLDPQEDEAFLLYTNGPLQFTPAVCAYFPSLPTECAENA